MLPLACCVAMGITITHDALLATTQVLSLTDGVITYPPQTDYIAIEIGCSDRDTMDETWLPMHPRGFLVSFEPLLDKYAVLLSRGNMRINRGAKDMFTPLGHHHRRGIVLPIAVTPNASQSSVEFHVSSIAGCSSMMHPMKHASFGGRKCKQTVEQRIVPAISLPAALNLTGRIPVKMLKIDAQGVDFLLIQSTPIRLLRERVENIMLETVSSSCRKLYKGQPSCNTVVQKLTSMGYIPDLPCPETPHTCELDITFSRGVGDD